MPDKITNLLYREQAEKIECCGDKRQQVNVGLWANIPMDLERKKIKLLCTPLQNEKKHQKAFSFKCQKCFLHAIFVHINDHAWVVALILSINQSSDSILIRVTMESSNQSFKYVSVPCTNLPLQNENNKI